MGVIEYQANGESIKIKVPFILKNAFKDCFRTAEWNSADKVWEVKNSKISLNKLAKFNEAGGSVPIADIEKRANEAAELIKVKSVVEDVINDILKLSEKLQDLESLQADLAAAKIQFREKRDQRNELHRKQAAVSAGIVSEIDEILKNYETKKNIAALLRLRSQRPSSENGAQARNIQSQLLSDCLDIESHYGIILYALRGLGNANWNRPDRDNIAQRAEGLYTNIERVAVPQS